MRMKGVFISTLLLSLISQAQASWLSEITGIDIDLTSGTVSISQPKPAAIPEMLKHLPRDAFQFFTNPAGNALALAIRTSKNAAKNTRPLPDQIKKQLRGYFPDVVLDNTRWTDNTGTLSLANILKNWLRQEGAVTLDNVIVFSDSRGVYDLELVSHELVHVMQYRAMGIDTFANIYTYAFYDLENQAKIAAKKIMEAKKKEQKSLVTVDAAYAKSEPLGNSEVAKAAKMLGIGKLIGNPNTCVKKTGTNKRINNCGKEVKIVVVIKNSSRGTEYFECDKVLSKCSLKPGLYAPSVMNDGTPISDMTFEWP